MKLVTYRDGSGVHHGRLRDTGGEEVVVELGGGDLLGLLEAGPAALATAQQAEGPQQPMSSVQLLAPLTRPPKLLALAANYQDHITEGGGASVDKTGLAPKLFLKPSSAIIGPGQPLILPAVSQTVDWELELAVVIGRRCRHLPVEKALASVAAYTIINDVSARAVDYGSTRSDYAWREFFDWLMGKWIDGFAPLGPYLLTADEAPDPQNLAMQLTVDGTVRQRANTRDMIFGVAEIIAFASRLMTL
ncbi:MAG TPA: fumarylacetoacetate hydrolase family protein, partial [Chloroflexota bacterium]|nr:fumarylacetoacetate hydrolase family protein [Chloroflexota bacterium]